MRMAALCRSVPPTVSAISNARRLATTPIKQRSTFTRYLTAKLIGKKAGISHEICERSLNIRIVVTTLIDQLDPKYRVGLCDHPGPGHLKPSQHVLLNEYAAQGKEMYCARSIDEGLALR